MGLFRLLLRGISRIQQDPAVVRLPPACVEFGSGLRTAARGCGGHGHVTFPIWISRHYLQCILHPFATSYPSQAKWQVFSPCNDLFDKCHGNTSIMRPLAHGAYRCPWHVRRVAMVTRRSCHKQIFIVTCRKGVFLGNDTSIRKMSCFSTPDSDQVMSLDPSPIVA